MIEKPAIAFIGLGNMGSKMARRLIAAGYPVSVFDVNRVAADTFAGSATVADDAPSAARNADYILTSLPTPAIVSEVYSGPRAVLAQAKPGSVAIDLSTIDPETARRVGEACTARDVAFLDAPVSRGVQAAEQGTLSIMVGGDPATLERSRAVLDHLASSVTHCGAVGSGQLVKLCNNMVAAATMAVLGEVLVAGVNEGLTTEILYRVMHSSSADSHILAEYFPRVVFGEARTTGFSLDFMVKDVDLYLAAMSAGPPSPLSTTVRTIFKSCQDLGLGARDATAVVEYYEGPTGVRLQMDAQVDAVTA